MRSDIFDRPVGMQINSVHTLYEAFGDDQCSWVHAGRFHDEHSADLIVLGEALAELTGATRDIRNRLAFIMVEAFQNVIRHGTGFRTTDIDRPQIMVRGGAQGFVVATVNILRSEDEEKLLRLLADLRGKPKEKLKELFLERLQGNKVSERGGAGLGLIEMARRSGRALVHDISRRTDSTSTFTLRIGIAANGRPEDEEVDAGTGAVRNIVAGEEILLAYRGAMPPAITQAIVRMLEKGVDDRPERTVARTRAWLAANEFMAETIGEKEEQCIVAIGSHQGADLLSLGMMLERMKADELVRAVQAVNAMTPMEQVRRYREGLLSKARGEAAPRLGLMDLARTGGGNLQCTQHAHGDHAFVTVMASL